MGKLLCKIWMFILKVVDAVVDGLLGVILNIVGALVSIVSALWDGLKTVADSIFGGYGSLLLFGGAGLLAWWLLSDDDDESEVRYV